MQNNSETRTTSILQRVPVILAVTAASYGLNVHASRPGDVQAQAKASQQQQQPHKR